MRYRRVHVQLVPKDSDARKSYDDRPRFDDKFDPERKQRKPNERQAPPSAEDKAHLLEMEKKIAEDNAERARRKKKNKAKQK